MLNLANLMKTSILSGFFAFGAVVVTAQPAAAGDGWGLYCGDSGYYCNDHYRNYDHGGRYYRGRYGYYRYGRGRYGDRDDWDGDGYHRWRRVCDSDGDRCYRSPGYGWNDRDHYRWRDYRWGD